MPEEFERLESLLRGLPLRQPPERLDRRLQSLWSSRPRRRRRLMLSALGAVLAMAAGLLAMVVLAPPDDRQRSLPLPEEPLARVEPAPPSPSIPQPLEPSPQPSVQIEQVWFHPLDRRVLVRDEEPPVVEERCQVTRRVCWVDQSRGITVQWTIAGEETIVAPLECF
mgnify:CR=1 FL=1